MTPDTFIQKYSPYVFEVERETGIPAIAVLAQGAHESDWSKKAIGNNLFGVKYKEGDWGYKEVLTTEHSKNPNAFKNKKIHSKVYDAKTGIYTFRIWDKFADYPTPKECFLAHARLLLTNRYKHALRWKYSPKRYLIAVWRAGYATDEYYGNKMLGGYCKRNMKTYYSIVDSVTRRLKKYENCKENIGIPGKENLGSSEREEEGYRDITLADRDGNGSISAETLKPIPGRIYSNLGDGNDGSGGGALYSKKGYNKETVKSYNKTEREVNSLIRFRLRLKIKLHDIKQFFLTLKKHKS